MKRLQWILSALLALQLVLSLVVFWPRPAATGAPLFPDLKTEAVIALTLQNSSGTLTLRKVNDTWVLPEAGDYPALTERVTSVLDKLVQLNTARLVTRTAASHKRLQVAADTYALKLTLETAAGTQTLYIGTSTGAGATHIRLEGQDEVYLAKELNSWELTPTVSSWIDTIYLKVPVENLTEVRVQNPEGQVRLVQDQAFWRLPGATLEQVPDQTKIKSLLSQIATLYLSAPLGKTLKPEYGLDQPTAVLTLTTAEKTITLQVGAKDAQGYVVSSSESPYYVRVAEYLLQPWVEATLASFIQTPTPTPLPTVEVTPATDLTPTSALTSTELLTPTVTPTAP